MAKAVNCEHPINGSPCNECASCKAIAAGAAMNVIEVDAASNNGVDNIRQITDSVNYSPSTGKYLVYIIDEVHMLRDAAYNALLKTLEEPPSYVIFILATTESHKIPATILSRCQRYDFHRIPLEIIADRLQELLDREGIAATREAVEYVARAADGSDATTQTMFYIGRLYFDIRCIICPILTVGLYILACTITRKSQKKRTGLAISVIVLVSHIILNVLNLSLIHI